MDWYYYDGKDRVGPLDDEPFKQAIASGKIKDTTLIWKPGMKGWQRFKDLSRQPEILAMLPNLETDKQRVTCVNCNKTYPVTEVILYDNKHICPNCKPEFVQRLKEGAPLPGAPVDFKDFTREIIHQDYDLSIGECIENGFALLKKYFWLVVGATFIIMIISSVSGIIPYAGYVFSLVLSGPLTGGLFYFFIRLARGQHLELGDAFDGFKGRNFLQLMLGYAVPMLFFAIAIIVIVLIIALFVGLSSFKADTLFDSSYLIFLIPLFLLIFVGFAYLFISWSFTLPLIIDKELNFWPAMQISFKMVNKHWFKVFGLMFVCGLIGGLGILLCCIGMFVTMPIFHGAMAYAYIEIFKG
ncbi:MAG: DUF4339 domain-containing protein [Desulfobacteraceae bacterium]|nr:MAG: DUF4339 domain-containing protein [Desulfobacteraceae bacterium]